MRSRKASKVVKPKKNTRRGTISTKNHRFQSFNERVARLKIDPIRRSRHADDVAEQSEETHTYFGKSLESWRDLNLSHTFTAFAKEAAPLCDSLPIVLHNEAKIVDLLLAHIEKADPLSLEPLLNLLPHFAHDLDSRFEKYFKRTVATVAAVAAQNHDPAVIEWSFTCLAWLFKYLSRVLVPDLRPLYELMAPYLGKTAQRPFIVRFAAESLSFLIRKAAAVYARNPQPLDTIINHIFQDLEHELGLSSNSMHREGVMTLLSESIKGVQGGLHSGGIAVFESILNQHDQRLKASPNAYTEVVTGTLTSLIHHTNSESFRPILDIISTRIETRLIHRDSTSITFAARLAFTVTTVRKGSRIANWTSLVSIIRALLDTKRTPEALDHSACQNVLSAAVVVVQYAPLDAVLPLLADLENVHRGRWSPYLVRFSDLLARLGCEKFEIFLIPSLQRFILESWQGKEDDILSLLPRLSAQGLRLRLAAPESFESMVLRRLESALTPSTTEIETDQLVSANIALCALPMFQLNRSFHDKLNSKLLLLIRRALAAHNATIGTFEKFALGPCFKTFLDYSDDYSSLAAYWSGLCNISSQLLCLPLFWSNLRRFLDASDPTPVTDSSPVATLEVALVQCLSMPAHSIRESALKISLATYKLRANARPEVLSTALTIESTPVSLESSRTISMSIRRLALAYAASASDAFLGRALPSYCFGILHFRLSQAWEDAVGALAEMSMSTIGEEVVASIAQRWLGGGTPDDSSRTLVGQKHQILDRESSGFQVDSDFDCSNLEKVSAICEQVWEASQSGHPSTREQFLIENQLTLGLAANAREQALRVLNKIPNIAEKRSRMLVPILLRWAGDTAVEGDSETEFDESRWTRKDQKAMLAVFAQFTNPRVLYKSSEVYSALLNLCANGDVEIQRSALKAVFTWKDPAVTRYTTHLTNLLDDDRMREEISVFLQDTRADDEDAILEEHENSLMPVLLRLLYGRAVSGSKHGQSAIRRAIFVALSRYSTEVLGMFVDIALGTLAHSRATSDSDSAHSSKPKPRTTLRKQLGMLNMMDDLLETLGAQLEPFATAIMSAVLGCTVAASLELDTNDKTSELEDVSLFRSVRHGGVQCLVKLFSCIINLDFSAEAKVVVDKLIAPRLAKFAQENTQAVSGVLRILSAWTTSPRTARYLCDFHDDVLEQLAELLQEPSTKDAVRLFVLQDVLGNLLKDASGAVLTQRHEASFVRSIGAVLNQQPSKDVLDACVETFTHLAQQIDDGAQAEAVVKICSGLLTKPAKIVSATTKTGLLRTLLPLIQKTGQDPKSLLYDAICGMFSRLQEQKSRVLLCSVLLKLCERDGELAHSAALCEELNSQGARLDEADHEKREAGFAKINEQFNVFTLRQWQPIVHNCLFFIRDADDLVNRSSASRGLELFLDAANGSTEDFKPLVSSTILLGIEYGVKNKSELVRAEYLRVLGHLIEALPDWNVVSDMYALTVDGDDEASFFTNVLHIQQHRRLRALRRLSEQAPHVKSNNVTKLILPLLEHFVLDPAEGDAGRTLSDQTVSTIGALGKALTWSAFRAIFKRYAGLLKTTEDHEKVLLRLLSALVDSISQHRSEGETVLEKTCIDRTEMIVRDFLPPLLEYIHLKDESTVDRRMPVAITIVKLLLLLPESEINLRLAPVLTDVCQVLRSKSQEARDQTRRTLATILTLVGPTYLSFVLKELRSALQRGSQLHVLSFTVHSLLVDAVPTYQPGDLDSCLSQLTIIIMDDIFGATGQEKDAEDYRSAMKEVKSSKSFDTMELLAKVTRVQQLGLLILPIRALLMEGLDSKMLKKTDDLLARVRKGVDQNAAADSREMLMFCHEIARQINAEGKGSSHKAEVVDYRVSKYLVKKEATDKSKSNAIRTSQASKLVSFGLSLLRKVIRRHEDLMTPSNLAGFLPIAGDALVQGEREVQLSAVRLLSTIMKVPLPELEANAPVYMKEAVKLIKAAPSMTTDSAKAALELAIAVLRERRSAAIVEKDIGDVLMALKASIDEPDRQGIIYKFLRAVLGRKVMATEVYEIMDEVGKVMVTNPDRHVREGARSAYLQFVLEYPQGKDRWKKQAAFFVENLKYDRSAGRQSVMELLHQLLLKLDDDVLAQLSFTLFVALVPVQVSDADSACRQMAGVLLAKLFERAGEEQLQTYLSLMNKWLQNEANGQIQIAATKCWIVLLRARTLPATRYDALRDEIQHLLEMTRSSNQGDESELTVAPLRTFEVLVEVVPAVAFGKAAAAIWTSLPACIASSEQHGRQISANLIGQYFSHVASSSAKVGTQLSALPLRGSEGLSLSADDMRRICSVSLRALQSELACTDEVFVAQNVRNLAFLGRCFAANGMPWHSKASPVSDVENEENDEDMEDGTEKRSRDPSALAYLLNRLSFIIRQERLPVHARTAAARCELALLNQIDAIPDLQALLRPLYTLTDSSISRPPGESYKALTDTAGELLDKIRQKVDGETYIAALAAVRSDANLRRDDRRQKRRIDAVTAPERWVREKRKKYEGKKMKAKARGLEAQGRRRGW